MAVKWKPKRSWAASIDRGDSDASRILTTTPFRPKNDIRWLLDKILHDTGYTRAPRLQRSRRSGSNLSIKSSSANAGSEAYDGQQRQQWESAVWRLSVFRMWNQQDSPSTYSGVSVFSCYLRSKSNYSSLEARVRTGDTEHPFWRTSRIPSGAACAFAPVAVTHPGGSRGTWRALY